MNCPVQDGNSVLLGAMLTFIPAMQLSSLEAAFLDKFSSESAQGILPAHEKDISD